MSTAYWTKPWNPWHGCTPLSAGCDHCYARALAKRFPQLGGPWDGTVRFSEARCCAPLRVKKPQVYFTSMSDPFHALVKSADLDLALEVVSACPQHQFLWLTKRSGWIDGGLYLVSLGNGCRELGGGDWLKNFWLGVTVEHQATVDRLDALPPLKRMGWHTWLSYEPALGPVDWPRDLASYVDWVTMGAETGPGARPCEGRWLEDLTARCQQQGVPVWTKALPNSCARGVVRREMPDALAAAGRLDIVTARGRRVIASDPDDAMRAGLRILYGDYDGPSRFTDEDDQEAAK